MTTPQALYMLIPNKETMSNQRLTEYQKEIIALSNGNTEELAVILLNDWICNEPEVPELFLAATGKTEIDANNTQDWLDTANYLIKLKS